MYRKACAPFVLMVAGELPGDPEVEKPYSLETVFEWLREIPEQIRRAVYLPLEVPPPCGRKASAFLAS
jgi:hypothetical protein